VRRPGLRPIGAAPRPDREDPRADRYADHDEDQVAQREDARSSRGCAGVDTVIAARRWPARDVSGRGVPPMSGVRTPAASVACTARSQVARRFGMRQLLEHQRAREHRGHRVRDPLSRERGARSRARARTGRPDPGGGWRSPRGRARRRARRPSPTECPVQMWSRSPGTAPAHAPTPSLTRPRSGAPAQFPRTRRRPTGNVSCQIRCAGTALALSLMVTRVFPCALATRTPPG